MGWNDFALRSYDPQIGRFMQNDPYDQFASGYVGMGNDPGNGVDPSGGWSGGNGKVPRDGPGRLYKSPDAAAWAWARFYREIVQANSAPEYSSAIYEIVINNVKFYSFTPASIGEDSKSVNLIRSPGPENYRKEYKSQSGKWDRSKLIPLGANIIGFIHSHPTDVGWEPDHFLSPQDRENFRIDHGRGLKYSYLFNYSGDLRVWSDSKDYKGTLIVSGLYYGTGSENENLANGGLGTLKIKDENSKLSENINLMGSGLYPVPDKQLMITNSFTGSYKIFNDRQVFSQAAQSVLRSAFPLVTAVANFSGISTISKGALPCPVF